MVEDFYLYILMRNDMDSLNPGKAVAQGAHAANIFVEDIAKRSTNFKREFKKWAGNRGYGTTITLSANEKQINDLIIASDVDYPRGVVIDETYPLQDGMTTHYFPCMTCAYIFAPRRDPVLSHLKLMK